MFIFKTIESDNFFVGFETIHFNWIFIYFFTASLCPLMLIKATITHRRKYFLIWLQTFSLISFIQARRDTTQQTLKLHLLDQYKIDMSFTLQFVIVGNRREMGLGMAQGGLHPAEYLLPSKGGGASRCLGIPSSRPVMVQLVSNYIVLVPLPASALPILMRPSSFLHGPGISCNSR